MRASDHEATFNLLISPPQSRHSPSATNDSIGTSTCQKHDPHRSLANVDRFSEIISYSSKMSRSD